MTWGVEFRDVCIPKRLDGSGYAWIRAKEGTIRNFGLDKVPLPPDGPFHGDSGSSYKTMTYSPRRMKGGTGYRIAFPDENAARGYAMARFQLSRHATNQTLLVLSEILDKGSAPWLWLLNYDGARMSKSHYMSKKQLSTGNTFSSGLLSHHTAAA